MLSHVTSSNKVSLLDVQQIHGSLVHVCFVYSDSSSHLPAISNFMSSFTGNDYARWFISNSMATALKWWHEWLSDLTAFHQLHPLPLEQDLGVYVDASTGWGIGLLIQNQWYAFCLAPACKIPGWDICWLEAVTLELLVYFLIQLNFMEVNLTTYSNSNGAIGAHSKGCSSNPEINLCMCHTYAASAANLLTLSFTYIESLANPADPVSQGIINLPRSAWLTRDFDLPIDLAPFLIDYHVVWAWQWPYWFSIPFLE